MIMFNILDKLFSQRKNAIMLCDPRIASVPVLAALSMLGSTSVITEVNIAAKCMDPKTIFFKFLHNMNQKGL